MIRAAICLLLLVAGCTPAFAQYVPPRLPPIARRLQPQHILRVATNAPPEARVRLPSSGVRDWQPGMQVQPGDLVRYKGAVYIGTQRHTAQRDCNPEAVPALFRAERKPRETLSAWRQPRGKHEAYKLGDRVKHKGKVWRSLVADNVWEPGVRGWIAELKPGTGKPDAGKPETEKPESGKPERNGENERERAGRQGN